ncbi:nucleoid-associated protein NdpA [compost metagenome]
MPHPATEEHPCLTIAILQQAETISVADDLTVSVSRHLDTSALHFAARINLQS